MSDPKDSPKSAIPETKPIEAPGGLDLHPDPGGVARISKRVGMGIVGLGLILATAFVYGGHRRQLQAQTAASSAGLPGGAVAPATTAAREFVQAIPIRDSGAADDHQLRPPGTTPVGTSQSSGLPLCEFDPRTGQPYRFDPQTGAPCSSAGDRIIVRQAPPSPRAQTAPPLPVQPSPEEQRIAAAYQRERAAMIAPTSAGTAVSGGLVSFGALGSSPSPPNDLGQIAVLNHALSNGTSDNSPVTGLGRALLPSSGSSGDNDFDAQNMQSRKVAFLAAAQSQKSDDYLRSTRTAPLGPYEIKAGWEIPAVLEQSLNSDLPGDLKALVMSNVYDTATGRSLLIPQGSRLIGRYDSQVAYGQDGVQVAWNRIIYPDASSIDINGMVGLDSRGNAGLRDEVDRHYTRLFGFSALTSLFEAAFDLSQRTATTGANGLVYPSVGDTASAAVGREMSQTGATITRRNLNVQPTIKVPAGYKFTVRVNRDILFDAPYEPMKADPQPITPGDRQLRRRTTLSGFSNP